MHITRYTDYSLRVLIYLAAEGDRLATIQEIADSYDISKNHLMKVVHQLNKKGYIETIRGKKGGMRLHMAPQDINIGILVRETEQDLSIVECFSSKNACKITPVCGLKSMFGEALKAFLEVLDRYTLADVIQDHHRPQLLRLLQIA
ncbi:MULTISPECIES: RrF2 family transcriptional regulator [Marinobacter]|jgi:Rrf2 family nitric oxide-sensitive transcriptional repressor|uniref:Rrf2 family transcriptional regulator n=2 Tax=Marinobacter nauticus TaxID=2743 RepID=A0A368UW84_MARNT|nr:MULTISPECIES: Rrf2 family transcriptional regulator [Marinobacter]MCG8522507.1 Rrf2 family transcriptional regulator [Pseudomonadales bacterium]MEC9039475.1 Rrf2 family transcriptional regulator [Pseudomonadota bacterium]ABM20145.1 transcriptional regulator, BadM/Rrf2 family [Marinobacter nauticus VT8]ERS00466.1 Rrf2 family transcriptional regulator [Marinobacter sp. EN3]ERS85815.1 Rrf2 family transcriptional regulator [Marinobacter sp. EVN1]|tara:strand:+ start:227 stop:664 length:438 start_codon:yes stop_codon:yes gene_type:complete